MYDTVTREAFKVKVEFLNYCQIENIYFYFYQGIYSKNTTKQDNLRQSKFQKKLENSELLISHLKMYPRSHLKVTS